MNNHYEPDTDAPDTSKLTEQQLRQRIAELEAENRKLANRVDNLEHDFGVLAFCGTAIDKRDIESLRTEISGEVTTILQDAHGRITVLEMHLKQVLQNVAAGMQFVPSPLNITLTDDQLKNLIKLMYSKSPGDAT